MQIEPTATPQMQEIHHVCCCVQTARSALISERSSLWNMLVNDLHKRQRAWKLRCTRWKQTQCPGDPSSKATSEQASPGWGQRSVCPDQEIWRAKFEHELPWYQCVLVVLCVLNCWHSWPHLTNVDNSQEFGERIMYIFDCTCRCLQPVRLMGRLMRVRIFSQPVVHKHSLPVLQDNPDIECREHTSPKFLAGGSRKNQWIRLTG